MRSHFHQWVTVIVVGAVLVGITACGKGTSKTVPSSPAAVAPDAHASRVVAVAYVAKTPIPESSYAHWRSVDARLGVAGAAGHQALGFLLTSQWVLDEAANQKVKASESEVKLYLSRLEQQRFPHAGMLASYMSRSGETEADLLARARVELLRERVGATVSAHASGSSKTSALASFQQSFRDHWQPLTICEPAYVMEDCSEYHGKRESLAVSTKPARPSTVATPARHTHRAGRRASKHRRSVHSAKPLNIEQELPPAQPGAMTLSSPAFELNGPIPAQYTCDGAGVSPPLTWQDVPKNAAALILFVIDDETRLPNGGIRWIVGDIDPKSTGVVAGQVPEGGIVGTNSGGQPGYGGICPAHGATTRVEFDMYALSKRLPLKAGFQPREAEYEYATQKLIIGKAATTYAGYNRP